MAPAQIALIWAFAQKDLIVANPGTTKLRGLEDNLGTINVELRTDDLGELDALTKQIDFLAARYSEVG